LQYQFCKMTTNSSVGCTVGPAPTSSPSGTFAGLTDGVTYYYFVRAMDAVGNTSAWSASTSSTQGSAPDTTKPVLTQITAVPTPGNDSTPSYTFHSTEAGTIDYGSCFTSSTTTATVGNNTVTFNYLGDGTYTCTLAVTDAAGNKSDWLNITSFMIDTTPPPVPVMVPEPQYTS
jgi:large repetitive protein